MKLPSVDWSELSVQLVITFGHFLWHACAVAIVLVTLEQLSSIVLRRSANMRYTVACLAFFALPVCVASTFAWVHQSRFGEESPEAALDYTLSIPKETRNQQLGYQLVSSLLRSKRFTWTEILDWMETKLPIERRSPEHYGLLASAWSQQDNTTFQKWFQSLSDAAIRDVVIIGFAGEGQTRDWPEILKLATSVTDQTKRQATIAWVLDAWKLTDPAAALAQLDNADVSKERRTQLHRDITVRLAQIANAQPVSENANPQQTHVQRSEKHARREEQILGQWDVAPTPAKTGIAPQAESMTLKFSEQGKFESYVQKQDCVEFAAGSWKLDGNKVSVRFKPFAMQPTDKSDVEATLQFVTPDTLILDGTRFLKRSIATPVALDAKHPLSALSERWSDCRRMPAADCVNRTN